MLKIQRKAGIFAMTKNRWLSSKNFLTMISVLSVLILFFCICAGVLFVLYRMHWLPFSFRETPARPSGGDFVREMEIPVYEEVEEKNVFHTEIPFSDALLKRLPLTDSFYLHICVTDYRNDIPYVEMYELWRCGEKYRLNRYNREYRVQSMITCDGEFAHIVDYVNGTEKYYLKKNGYELQNVSPLPDFSQLLRGDYALTYYSEDDGFCTVKYENPEFHLTDEIKIEKESGILYSYIHAINGKTVRTVKILTADPSFVFDDSMFQISQQ